MTTPEVRGFAAPGFEGVEAAFAEVLRLQGGAGASLALWHQGEWLVDLWGGWADAAHSRAWAEDTLVMPYSVTKPFAAMPALLLADRGELDLDAPLHEVWPELRATITMRQALSHRAGLVALDEPLSADAFHDWDGLCGHLAVQEPAWEPGTAYGESALLYGHLVGEPVRRIDGRSLGTFLAEEVCTPLDLDFHIGLDDGQIARTADLVGFGPDFWPPEAGSRPALFEAALTNPAGALDPLVLNGEPWRRAEVPAVNGHGTAKAVAGLYVCLQQGDLLSADMLAQLTTSAGPMPELVLGEESAQWGLGVGVDDDGYGMGGLGGGFGWWSERHEYALGFVTSFMGDFERADLIDAAVSRALGIEDH